MGHPPPSAAAWRRELAELGLSRPARQLGEWISSRPLVGRPGLYRAGQLPAARALRYGERTVRRAQAELVDRGLLTVTERGASTRAVSVVELALPGDANRPTRPVSTGHPRPV